jgi:hypothetical protein
MKFVQDTNKRYLEIMHHYDACLLRHGDTARGADWPNEIDRQTRFTVMLDVVASDRAERVDLIDVGCGTGEVVPPRPTGEKTINLLSRDRYIPIGSAIRSGKFSMREISGVRHLGGE